MDRLKEQQKHDAEVVNYVTSNLDAFDLADNMYIAACFHKFAQELEPMFKKYNTEYEDYREWK